MGADSMLVTAERDNLLEKVRDGQQTTRTVSTAQLVSQTVSVTTLWLTSVLSALAQLQREGALIPGVGDLRIPDATLDCAGRVLSSIRQYLLPTPNVGPVSGGGVSIVWELDDQQVEVVVFPGERVLLSNSRSGELTEDPIELTKDRYAMVNSALERLVAA